MNSRRLIRESEMTFVHVSGLGIFKRHPSKKNMVDKYYSTDEVIKYLNGENLKICIVDSDDCLLESNFKSSNEVSFK